MDLFLEFLVSSSLSGIIEHFKARIKEEGGIDSAAFREFEALFMDKFDKCSS
jgi:hypothetical protein